MPMPEIEFCLARQTPTVCKVVFQIDKSTMMPKGKYSYGNTELRNTITELKAMISSLKLTIDTTHLINASPAPDYKAEKGLSVYKHAI